jgi:GAF domain-containing protein/HAMP domain-containing protein
MMKKRFLSIFDFLEKATPLGRFNLRAKLTFGNVLIIVLAILGMGYYVYFRVQQANTTLTAQLETNARNRTEDSLLTTSREQAAQLDSLFASMSRDTAILRSIQEEMFSREFSLNSGEYWDARSSLTRLPSGNWDNPDQETASVFIPAHIELTDTLVSKLNVIKQIELVMPSMFASNPDIVAIYFGGTTGETIYYPNINLAALVPPDFDVTGRSWFVNAAPDQNLQRTVVWSTPYQDAAGQGLVITTSAPVFRASGQFYGVTAMDIQLTRITNLVSNIRAGRTGYAFLIDSENRLIALPEIGYADFGLTAETAPLGEILDAETLPNADPELLDILNGIDELTVANFSGVERYIVRQEIPEVGYTLVMIVPSQELLQETAIVSEQIARETRNAVNVSIVLVLGIFAAATLASFMIGERLTSPLKSLIHTANEIIAGDFEAKSDVRTQDEIGTLAQTLNTMTAEIRDLVQSLEQRVAERTQELEIALQKGEQRGRQYETVTKVSQAISTMQNIEELLPHIANVISQQFGFYHVGIFLNDPNDQYAVLSAANSKGGQRMLKRGHQLRIGEQGIVGYVTSTGRPRIALDVGEDVTFFNNPDLPDTHSEMALPLKIGGSIIGALDVQSTEINAFSNDDVEVLSTLADQVSLAIQNARLYQQMERSLAEAEAISRQYFRDTWSRLPDEKKISGARYSVSGSTIFEDSLPLPQTSQERQTVSVPIRLRGETIGTLAVLVPKQETVNQDQMDLIKAVAERVAISAENARLFEETTRRAEREHMVSEITAKIRETNDPDEMLRRAVEELQRALNVTRIEIVPQKVHSTDR